jgi:hypothetical protein
MDCGRVHRTGTVCTIYRLAAKPTRLGEAVGNGGGCGLRGKGKRVVQPPRLREARNDIIFDDVLNAQ